MLNKGSFFEQKSFIRSFIKSINFNDSTITIEYVVPLKTNKAEAPLKAKEVLPTSYIGCPNKAEYRTFQIIFNIPVYSR